MATFPGKPPNPLGAKVELLLGGVWTDITAQYVMLRDQLQITNMGRGDESSSISPCQLTLTLKNNDGRFTPKNSAGAYYPNILRNTQIRVSVNATSATAVAYSGFRFFGEISSWPPGTNISGRDNYVTITASGIWRRISQSSATIGSAFSRYHEQLTGSSVPLAYWAMEDGNNSTAFVPDIGSTGNGTFTGTPSFSSDGTSFGGSDALPQFNQSRITFPVSGGTPTNNVVRFALSVPAAGDSQIPSSTVLVSGVPTGAVMNWAASSGKIRSINVWIDKNWKLTIRGRDVSNTILFTATTTTPVNGVPVLVSVEITPSGGNVAWAMKIIKPGAGSVLDSVSGTVTTATTGAITFITLNGNGQLADTSGGHLAVIYSAVPSLITAASALSGYSGEFAVDRFTRLCGEFGIATEVIGSASAAMGPQADDTLQAILQSIEDTDGGLLFESRTQFGLGYRTLGSLQNQSAAATLNYTAGVLGAPPAPAYDDQLVKNQWTVTNYDGYTALATLTSGAISVVSPPNGVGVYAGTAQASAASHSQVNALAQQRLFLGTVDDVRYPTVVMNMARAQAAALFASVPGLRVGDHFQLTNLPGTLGGSSTSKQLAWGYAETISHNSWVITFNAIPELPFETTFSPGVYSVGQAPVAGVAQGSAVGSSVAGSQLPPGSVPAGALSGTISARTIGGTTSFVSSATPYDWTFAVSGTPADVTYFTCTEVQALPITVGDTFTNSSGLGGPFTVTSIDPPSGGNVNVHFSPDASSVMSTGTLTGGKNGDTWVNTSGGNQVNIWANGAWTPVTWTASSVLAASSITAGLIAAGIIIAGIVDGTLIQGATIIADGTSGEILVYSGTPASGNLIGSWSGASGTDAQGNAFPAGLAVEQGGLVLVSQGSSPAAVSGASTIYTSSQGRLRYLSASGNDLVLDRSVLDLTNFSMTTQTIPHILSSTINYLADEAIVGSEFEIEIDGTYTTPAGTSATFTFDLFVDGAAFGAGSAITVGTVINQTGLTYAFTARWRATVNTAGAGGNVTVAVDGGVTRKGVNVGGATSQLATLNNILASAAFDTTANHSLAVYCNWSSTAGTGHSAIVYRTKKTRRN